MQNRLITLILLLVVIVVANGATLADPPALDPGAPFDIPYFANKPLVDRLAQLLDDKDPIVRETAAHDLGETHNPYALGALRRAMDDAHPLVRAAAVRSLSEIGGRKAADMVIAAVGDDHATVVLTALAAIRSIPLSDAAMSINTQLAKRTSAKLQVPLLNTLTSLGKPADATTALALLKSDSPAVRWAVLNNLAIQSPNPALVNAVKPLIGDPSPIVKAAALKAWFLLNPLPASLPADGLNLPELTRAKADKNALIRRAAVIGAQRFTPQDIPAFLNDPSPLVRLEAIQAAGALKLDAQAWKIVELMIQAKDLQTHQAGVAAVNRLSQTAIASPLAKGLDEQLKAFAAGPEPLMRKQIQRNLLSLLAILGGRRIHTADDHIANIISTFPIESPVLGQAAVAAGELGLTQTVDRLSGRLADGARNGLGSLRAMMSQNPGPPYNERTHGQIAQALVRLKAVGSYPAILKGAQIQFQGIFLNTYCAFVAQNLPMMTEPENAATVKRVLEDLLNGDAGAMAQYQAILAAGKMKSADCLGALQKILENRDSEDLMAAAAWAIKQINGQSITPQTPKDRPGSWIIKPSRR